LLKDLPPPSDVKDTDDTREPIVFWDTQGGDFPEKTEDEDIAKGKGGKGMSLGDSKSNEGEAALVKLHAGNLIDAGVPATDIAVITPYNAQVGSSLHARDGAIPLERTGTPHSHGSIAATNNALL
jgi:DNA polymerase alpha-associated DNA helicase A